MQSYRSLRLVGAIALILFTNFASAESASQYALYLSDDHAHSWSRSDLGLPVESRINAIAASAENLIAGTDAGLFVSTNGAKSWQPALATKTNRVTSLAALDRFVFAGTSNSGLLTSADHGFTWQRNPSFPDHMIRSLHALDGSIYVGTDANHVYQSPDHGRTWHHLAAGLPEYSQVSTLTSLDGRIFAGLYAKGLFTWDAAQKKWLQLGSAEKIAPLALAASGGTIIAGHNPGGIYASDDLGRTWHHWSLSPGVGPAADHSSSFSLLDSLTTQTSRGSVPAVEAPIWEMSVDSRIAIAGAGSGVYYSIDHARTWTRATTGLPSQSFGIAFLIHGKRILAAIHQGTSDCTRRQ